MKDRIPLHTEALEGAEHYHEVLSYDKGASIFMAPMHWLAARTVNKLMRGKTVGATGQSPLPRNMPIILDLGTGTGRMAFMMLRTNRNQNIIGLDISRNMLKRAKELVGATGQSPLLLIQATAQALPFKPGTFDAVVSAQSLHHWHSPEDVLKESDRVVKQNGVVAIFDAKRPKTKIGWTLIKLFTFIMNPRHRHHFPKVYGAAYTIGEVRDMLAKSGLSSWNVEPHIIQTGLKIIKK